MKKVMIKIWFKYFASKPKIKIKPKQRFRIYWWNDSNGNKIERPDGLPFGLWCMSNTNKDIAIRALN